MKWLTVLFLSSFLTSSYCYNEKRLLQAFSAFPNPYYATLAERAILPNVQTYHHSIVHLRVYANNQNADAMALLAKEFSNNQHLYQSTLINAAKQGSLIAREQLAAHYEEAEQWQALHDFPWPLTHKQQTRVAMALGLPLAATAHQLVPIYKNEQCTQKIMLAVTDLKAYNQVTQLKQRFEKAFSLPVCLSQPVYFDRSKLQCDGAAGRRIRCEIRDKKAFSQISYDKIAFFSETGIANASGNYVFMRSQQSERVLLHELMHLYGFIDEYPLKKQLAKRLCNVTKPTRIAKNLIVVPKKKEVTRTLKVDGHTWYLTNTCNQAEGRAYKPVKSTSNLELLDLPLPDLYETWLKQAMSEFNSL
ncbi:hypothetical protein [Pseudoalteromonas spongiae]|uniref:hypothetical protein n=1 Tax=Pseudoalteromonas spongiae TaxID=298657 RepID=UPI000C2CEDA2|nr:hypothetical protein [Pseudoalteromonas spongiae]